MPKRQTYGELGDACRAVNALDLVGDRWTLAVVRELILGAKRFADLLTSVRGITPAVLTTRLRMLQEAGVIEQIDLANVPPSRAYVATEWGRGLEVVLQALGRWYSAGPDPTTSGGMTPDAMVLAMRTMAPATDVEIAAVALGLYDARLAEPPTRRYRVGTHDGALVVESGTPEAQVASITVESTAWGEVLFGHRSLEDAQKSGVLTVEGKWEAVKQLVALYAFWP